MEHVKCLKWLNIEDPTNHSPPLPSHDPVLLRSTNHSAPLPSHDPVLMREHSSSSTLSDNNKQWDQPITALPYHHMISISQSECSSPTDNNSPEYFSFIPNIEPDNHGNTNSEFSYHGDINSEFSYHGDTNSEFSYHSESDFLADFKMDTDDTFALSLNQYNYLPSYSESNKVCCHENKVCCHGNKDSELLPTIDEVFYEFQTQINWSVSLCRSRVTTAHDGSSGLSDEECFSPIQSPQEMSKEEMESVETTDSTDLNMDIELQTSFDVWFQTDLSREHAENLLVQQPVGTFYIRASSKKDYFALSVHISTVSPTVEHYLVHKSSEGLQMDNSPLKFPNFVKLLAFFAQSKTYSATTGIPVQLKIPRLITSTANTSASVYDQIEAQDLRQPQSTDKPSEQRPVKSHSPPPRTPPNQPLLSTRPKSLHFASHFKFPEPGSTYENVMKDNMKDSTGVPPPKPPKPKNYRSRDYPEGEDLIYINLDKGPDKPEPMLTCRYRNDLNYDSEKKRSVKFRDVDVHNKKNIKLNRKGPAIFHAPPPPPYEDDEDGRKRANFIPPSPPTTPPSIESEDESEMGSSISSIYTSKTSIDQAGAESRGMRQRPHRPPSVMDKVRSRVFKDRSQRQSVRAKLCHKLQSQILRLPDTHDCTFGARVSTFVTFVKQQHEKKADRLLLQIREFMCTIKHEMISARSTSLEDMVARAQRKGPPPKLNDLIEGVLVKAVIWPLRAHIHSVLYEGQTEENVTLRKSMNLALTKTYEELGINKDIFCGEEVDWTEPVQCLQDICSHYSPVKKLERLLACVNSVYTIIKDINIEMRGTPRSIGADEFLPLFIYVVALSGIDKAGEEIRYMQGLLDPPLLIGEPGYYLTTLASSVMLLKSLEFDKPHILPSVGHLQSMLQIHFTDPDMKQIAYKTLPVHQSTTCKDLLDILGAKFRLESSSNYGLYKVEDDVETLLDEAECPQLIKGQWLVASLERDINSYFTFHLKS